MMYAIHNSFGLTEEKLTNTVTDGGSNFCASFKKYSNNNHVSMREFEEEYTDNESDEEGEEDVFTENDIEIINLSNELEQESVVDIVSNDLMAQSINFGMILECVDEVMMIGDEQVFLPSQMRCFSHLLNNVGSKDFEDSISLSSIGSIWKLLLERLHRFWYFLRKSSMAKKICKDISGTIFRVPNTTRWNSLYNAIKDIIDKEEAFVNIVNKIISDLKPKNFARIKPNQMKILKDYITHSRQNSCKISFFIRSSYEIKSHTRTTYDCSYFIRALV